MTVLPRLAGLMLFLLTISSTYAQQLTQITYVEVEYLRSFHGTLRIWVNRTESNTLEICSALSPGFGFDARRAKFSKARPISETDLAPIAALINDGAVREHFANLVQSQRRDGSTLTMTVFQHSLSVAFRSRDAFTKNPPAHELALRSVVEKMFVLAGITIPERQLY